MASNRGRAIAGGILAIATLVALTACTPHTRPRDTIPHDAPSGGQTLNEMQETINSIPGLRIVRLVGGGEPNIKGNTGYDISLALEPGYRITDGPALVTFLIQSLWSVRDGYLPNAQIGIDVNAGAGSEFIVAAAADEAGWQKPLPRTTREDGHTFAAIVMYDGTPARDRLGDWPGDVPSLPPNLTAKN